MGDVARAFHGENEPVRGFGGPAGKALRALQGVKSAIDLHGIEDAGREGEFLFLRKLRRIEDPAPRLISPARYPDPYVLGGSNRPAPVRSTDAVSPKAGKAGRLGLERVLHKSACWRIWGRGCLKILENP